MPKATTPPGFRPLKDTILFQPLQFGRLTLQHRVIQAPLTRMRASKESDGVFLPGDLAVKYYEQRASKGGLQLTEATDIAHYASGYPGTPGVFTPSQLEGWKRVTDAVHAKGGFIFCQLWHTGRASAPGMLGGRQPLSSSNIPMSGNALDGTVFADAPPKAMTVEEIRQTTQAWGQAARNAIAAGFDGVEIHGANGYLLDQFLHDNINNRSDDYGGSIEKRSRFVLEVIREVCSAVGADRVGIRLSPYNYFQDTKDSNPNKHWAYLCEQISTLPEDVRPVYVHSVEPRFDEVLDENAKMDALNAYTKPGNGGIEAEATTTAHKGISSLTPFRRILQQGGVKFIAAGNFNRDNAGPKVKADEADAIVFGRHFIANPDLPLRLAEGYELNQYDRSTFYGADPPQKGYTDYPFYGEQ